MQKTATADNRRQRRLEDTVADCEGQNRMFRRHAPDNGRRGV